MPILVGILIIFIIFGTLYCYPRVKKFYEDKNLKKYIHDAIFKKDVSGFFYNDSMHERLVRAQSGFKFSAECYIYKADKELTNIILNEFKKHLVKSFLSDNLSIPSSRYAISEEACIMYFLTEFLRENQYKMSLAENEMYDRIPESDKCNLTDFGVVFYKIYLISCSYCKQDGPLNSEGSCVSNETIPYLQDVLSTKQITR